MARPLTFTPIYPDPVTGSDASTHVALTDGRALCGITERRKWIVYRERAPERLTDARGWIAGMHSGKVEAMTAATEAPKLCDECENKLLEAVAWPERFG